MKTKLNRAASLLIAASALFLAHAAQAEIVYQNATGDLATILNPGTFEVGDEIILAGSGRAITNFTFQYTASFSGPGTRQAQLRFYNNNGLVTNGFNAPGTMFFNSGLFPIGGGTNTLIFEAGNDFPAGGQLAPDHFTWSVQFSGLTGGDTAGPNLFNPVTVGTNYNDYWDYNGSAWTLRQSTNGVPINFAARIEAVPEPSIIALGVLGCVLGWGLSRRKHQ